jgi:hypothetical protein
MENKMIYKIVSTIFYAIYYALGWTTVAVLSRMEPFLKQVIAILTK